MAPIGNADRREMSNSRHQWRPQNLSRAEWQFGVSFTTRCSGSSRCL